VQEHYKTDYLKDLNTSNKLVHSPYFKSNYLKIQGTLQKEYSSVDSFVVYICVEGSIKIDYENKMYTLIKDDTILFPACINHIKIKSNQVCILEISI